MTKVVSQSEWQSALDAFRIKEKEQMRRQDALNAERRRLPRVKIDKPYEFTGAGGKAGLLDMFEGRKQLITYNFMYGPDAEAPCTGCSMMVDNMGDISHLHARNTSLVLIARSPYDRLVALNERMGWKIPWYSSYQSDFNRDFGATTDNGEMFGVNVFIREGNDIYRTYYTTRRGVEYLGSIFTYLDLTPMGRQELWEDSPEEVPQTPPYQWWRKHDEYVL
ncbi:DUF899 domain-containing protein [Microbulbifer halophilus]|uniref:DUF899 domain-containing protein n=1 Tax=Microbulbifer halophilus TaxID=453963 RepID=A0ABW5EEK2_9GAMM|nr:DUF899 domain-containing protein [Microbulbifer halophilus]MCW8127720.1 DUF899 domain-containing protein [Microbulbifer halophilus]